MPDFKSCNRTYLSLDYLKSLPKAMTLSSVKQQSTRKSMPVRKGARVLSRGTVIKDHITEQLVITIVFLKIAREFS